jgi:hypothetical protein
MSTAKIGKPFFSISFIDSISLGPIPPLKKKGFEKGYVF